MVETRKNNYQGVVVCKGTKQPKPPGLEVPGTTSDTGVSEVPVQYDKTSKIVTNSCKVVLLDIFSKIIESGSLFEKMINSCGDGSKVKIFYCKSNRVCKLKENFVARDTCVIHVHYVNILALLHLELFILTVIRRTLFISLRVVSVVYNMLVKL